MSKVAQEIDNTLVWAVHDGVELAGFMGRQYIASNDWREVDDTHPKVKAALSHNPATEPSEPDLAPSEPARRKGQTTKEKDA